MTTPKTFGEIAVARLSQEQWVLLWSQAGGTFHIETLGDMLKAHRCAFRDDIRLAFVPLHIGDRNSVDEIVSLLGPVVAERWNSRSAGQPDALRYEELP